MATADTRDALLTLGHELRRPLTVIRGAVSLLLESDDRLGPDRERQMLEMIDAGAIGMSQLVEQILLLCHLDADDLRLELEPVPATVLVTAAAEAAGAHPGDPRVTLPAPGAGPALNADRDRSVTVLQALIDNALRVSPPGEPVELAVVPEPGGARLDVRDRGPGLSPDQVDAAFSRYVRLDNPGGCGLGLYLARELARRMSGDVGYEPREGGGAVFWFRLASDG